METILKDAMKEAKEDPDFAADWNDKDYEKRKR